MTREPIGEIKCPWCRRDAELHRSESRPKLNPDQAKPLPSYPAKLFVICPPIKGYRGCGTTLANSGEAQARMLDNGTIFGPGPRKAHTAEETQEKPAAAAAKSQPVPVVQPAPPPARKTSIFDW